MDSRCLASGKDSPSGPINWNTIRLLFSAIAILVYSENSPLLYAQSLQDLVFVQIPVQEKSDSWTDEYLYSPLDRYVDGARIVILQKSATQPVNLTPEFTAACDPDISFDGETIIFSGKRTVEGSWQIWRMNYDGSQKTQISREPSDCYAPVHAGNRFYLNDPQPTPQIIYVGTAHNWRNELEGKAVTALYGTDPKGETIRRLTFNLHSDFSPNVLPNGRILFPDVLPNGRILFTSWQKYGASFQTSGVLAFLAVNNDGTDLMPFYGNHDRPLYKDMVDISTYDDRVYFIESEDSVWLGGGDIAFISRRRPLHSYQKLIHEDNGRFHSPCAVPDGGLIASFRSEKPDAVFGVHQINPKNGKRQKRIWSESGWHSIDTQVLEGHPEVKGRSNWLIPGAKTGVFYCLNSYRTNLDGGQKILPGTIKYVRVIEGLPQKHNVNRPETHSHLSNEAEKDKDYVQVFTAQRILGVAPVEKDGSFNLRVPSEIPLTFQLLDSAYQALRSQKAWTWVMGNENRGCIGCHEDREMAPPNKLVDAVKKPPVDLTRPAEERRTVDFRHQIVPIVESKCSIAGCLVSGKARLNLDVAHGREHEVYESLVRTTHKNQNEQYVVPGKARESRLIWYLFGQKLSSEGTNHASEKTPMHPELLLESHERLSFIEWIDLGAHWDSLSRQTKDSL